MATLLLGLEPAALAPEHSAEIERLAKGYHLLITTDEAVMQSALEEIEIAAARVPHTLVLQMPRVRWFQQWGAGVDWLMNHPEIVERDVIITNVSGVHAIPISEHIFALLLALARRIPEAVQAQKAHQWYRQEMGMSEVFELAGKTMVLVGVGDIGARTAKIAASMDIRVIGVRRNPERPAPGIERMVGPAQLREVLPEADLLVLTVPLTPETEHLIGEAELRLLKPTSILVNIGRGRTVDQAALVRALQEGWIGGAGLDVTDPEPLPADSPLWDMPNVLITAHYSGRTPAYEERAMEIFLDNLARYVSGQPLRNVVDKRLGY